MGNTLSHPKYNFGSLTLYDALLSKDIETLRQMIKQGHENPTIFNSVYAEKFHYTIPLYYAIKKNMREPIELLMDYGFDIDFKYADGATMLYNAVKTKDHDMVEKILSYNPKLVRDPSEYHSMCPLCHAIRTSNINALHLIVTHLTCYALHTADTFDIDLKCSNFTLLELAMKLQSDKLIPKILELKPKIIYDENNCGSALYYAFIRDPYSGSSVFIIDMFLKYMEENQISINNIEPLLESYTYSSDMSIVKRLFELQYLNELKTMSPEEATVSIKKKQANILYNLCNIHDTRATSLNHNDRLTRSHYLQYTDLIINVGLTSVELDINNKINSDITGYETVIEYIASQNLDLENLHRDPPILYSVVDFSRWTYVEILLKHGANPNIGANTMKIPLRTAVSKKSAKVVAILLKYGADPNIEDAIGETPLFEAIYAGDTQIINLLLEAPSINIYKANNLGQTPFSLSLLPSYVRSTRSIRNLHKKCVLKFLAMIREYVPDSLLHYDYFPKDMFNVLCTCIVQHHL